MTDLDTAERLAWVFEHINAHDVPTLREVWTPTSVVRFPDATCVGTDQIAGYFTDKIAAITGLQLEVLSIVADGEHGFVEWFMTGVHSGPVLGIAGTGRPIALPGMDHFVLADGVVKTNSVVFDQLEFARQMGLLPRDGTRTDRLSKTAFNQSQKLRRRLTSSR